MMIVSGCRMTLRGKTSSIAAMDDGDDGLADLEKQKAAGNSKYS